MSIDHWLSDDEPDDNLLFHYTRERKVRNILLTQVLRLSPYAFTNDPRETKEWIAETIIER